MTIEQERRRRAWTRGSSRRCCATRRFLQKNEVSPDLRTLHQIGGRDADTFYRDRWSHDKVVRSTHGVNCTGLVLVEGVRQGRHHHVGGAADRLPVDRPGPPRVRAARLPARRRVLLVHVLAHPRPVPVRPRRAARDVPRGQGPARATRCWRGRTSSATRCARRGTRPRAARAGWCARRGPRPSRWWPRPTCTRSRSTVRTGSRGSRPIPAMSMVSHGVGCAVLRAAGRPDALVLRLVRGPAGRLAAGVRRPDRRAGVGGLVGRGLPDHVGLERAGDPHARTRTGWSRRGTGGRRSSRCRPDYADNVKFADEWLAPGPGHRRRARDGDGARGAAGVLRRADHAVLRAVREAVHRPAVPGDAGAATVTGSCPASSSRRRTSGRPRRTRSSRRSCSTRRPASPVVPNGSLGLPVRRRGRGPLEPRPGRRVPAAQRGRRRVRHARP